MGLWDRVNEKRKQKTRDTKQDDEIKKLRDQVEKAEKRSEEREQQLRRRDEIGDNFQRSGAMIQREYDEGYGRMGRKFAVGDGECDLRGSNHSISLTPHSNYGESAPSPGYRSPADCHPRSTRCACK